MPVPSNHKKTPSVSGRGKQYRSDVLRFALRPCPTVVVLPRLVVILPQSSRPSQVEFKRLYRGLKPRDRISAIPSNRAFEIGSHENRYSRQVHRSRRKLHPCSERSLQGPDSLPPFRMHSEGLDHGSRSGPSLFPVTLTRHRDLSAKLSVGFLPVIDLGRNHRQYDADAHLERRHSFCRIGSGQHDCFPTVA